MKNLFYVLLCIVLFSCANPEPNTETVTTMSTIENGLWKFSFLSQKHEIPIIAEINKDQLTFRNADERVIFTLNIKGDSLFVPIPNFDSHLEGVIQSPTLIKGVFIKDYVEDYSIQFIAKRTDEKRFGSPSENQIEIKDKYKTEFYSGDKVSPAIGIFKQDGDRVSASFAKETGDYRYLEGQVLDSTLYLSTFDGSHLYLFIAKVKGDSLVDGKFISGKGGNYAWAATYSPDVTLRDPEELTYLKEGYKTFDFKAVDLDNKICRLEDEKFVSKLKIIQITGTWCPNCLDETRYFTQLYSKYKDAGLEIIALAFENGNDTSVVLDKLNRYKLNNSIEYPFLYAGKSGSKNASEAFPMLNKIMSFPTAIYLNEDNEVLKVYTGFYGPGTGEYYFEYTEHTEAFIESILY